MPLHLLKLAVGVGDLASLRRLQRERARERGFYCFYTRNMPRREAEVLDGGSVYWVIKGFIEARQRIRAFVPIVNRHGRPAVLVKLAATLVLTQSRPHRAFQGWRYLEPDEAPSDRPKGTSGKEMPAAMARELRELGLL
ncbi:MAG TPA: DUF1489 domain-containing protein [Stellaceae bacterium]|nr:DUF1489 domain-containing protein [Stellaceae bacterium]